MNAVVISFLGLISIPCFVVVAIAIVRRSMFNKPWPKSRDLVLNLLISCGITLAITLGICLVFKWTGFFESQFYRPSKQDYAEQQKLESQPEEVYFASEDGTQLHGWFFVAEGEPIGTIIHFHGSDRNISFTVRNSHWLTAHGLNVFVFDYRGYGKSSGQPVRQGVVEDSVAAINYVRSRPDIDPDKICLWGQSMGGQLAIVAADIAGKEGIQGVVAEATYASYSHHVKDKVARLGPLWLIQWGAWLFTSDQYCALDVVDDLSPTPVLLVHGTSDRAVQPYHSERLFNSAGDPKEIWRVEDAAHLNVFVNESNRDKLVEFLKQSLQSQRADTQSLSE